MTPGLRNIDRLAADIVVTSSIVPVAVFTIPVGAGSVAAPKAFQIRYNIPLTVGATGGVRLVATGPAGIAEVSHAIQLNNTQALSITPALQVVMNSAFTSALANAGAHSIQGVLSVENAGVAGDIVISMAQNTSDALSLTVLEGATAEITAI